MENRGGPASILVSGTHGHHPEWEGKTVEQLSQEFQMDPVDTVIQVLEQCDSSVACIYFCINEADMLRIMLDMNICVGSDGYNFSYEPLPVQIPTRAALAPSRGSSDWCGSMS